MLCSLSHRFSTSGVTSFANAANRRSPRLRGLSVVDFVCLLTHVLSKRTSVTYISAANIIETGPGAVASCSEIRHDPKDESLPACLPGGLSRRRPGLVGGGGAQVIYRKVKEHEEWSGGGGDKWKGRGFEV